MAKKRKKSSRYRGSRTHGRGRKNRTRGSGNRGGVGLAGTGKRGDAKKTLVIKLYGRNYFGKDKALRRGKKIPLKEISIENIAKNLSGFVNKGIAKEEGSSYVLNLKEYKIIGNAALDKKLIIHAKAATKGAYESVRKAGGEIFVEAGN